MPELVDALLRVLVVVIAFLVTPLLVGQAEHKVMAHMQSRVGPMYAGSFHGWAQLVADGVKFVQKEDVVPTAADRRGLQAGAGGGVAALSRRAPRHTPRPGTGGSGPRPGAVLRARGDGRRRGRHPDGRLVQRQQVQPPRRHPGRSPADVLRAAPGPRRRIRRDGGRDAVPDRHRGGLGAVVAGLAGHCPGGLLRGRPGGGAATAVRHAGRRRRAGIRPLHGVRRPAVRTVPAGRVRRHRGAQRADRGAVPGWLARPLRAPAGLAVDAGEDVLSWRSRSSGRGSPGPGCARTS